MPLRSWIAIALLVVLAGVAYGTTGTVLAVQEEELPPGAFVARVYYDDSADVALLAGYDIWDNNRDQKYLVVVMNAALYRSLEQQGFRLQIDEARTAELNQVNQALPGQVDGIPGYPCYRTVEETYASAQQIVADHPTLAAWIDVGDSWEKTVGLGGYDLMVLRLTNADVPGPKPRLFAAFSIHAREYAPAELGTRFAEYLIDNYGVDADVTWLLDYHELHLMLQANPDGRKQAEYGDSWRKNTNDNYCPFTPLPPPYGRGADLNRNFEFQWGCCGGSSGLQCDATYRGPSPASEPETQAIQAYMLSIFGDNRDDPLDAPAPEDTPGVFLDVHSYGELILWPWGFIADPAPNGTAMQTLGRKLAYFNGYEPDQAIGLYPTDGTTDDYSYGELGVASIAYELGTAFFQDCSSFESTILPDNVQSLLYAAKAARTPYLIAAGPDSLAVTATPASVQAGTDVALTATIDDTRFNNQNGAEPDQNIAAAEYYVDVPPWDTASGPVSRPMAAVDGAFDDKVEDVVASVDTTALSPGDHILYVRGQDVDGNWGAVSAVFLNVEPCVAPDPVSGLSIVALDNTSLRLEWAAVPGASEYQVWSAADEPYFDLSGLDCATPGPYSCTVTADTTYEADQLGGVDDNYAYLVRAVSSCGAVSASGERVGEFDYLLVPGMP